MTISSHSHDDFPHNFNRFEIADGSNKLAKLNNKLDCRQKLNCVTKIIGMKIFSKKIESS